MKKWIINGFIAVYLSAMSWGIVAHALSFATASHPAMYFVVWDMFCGWSSYSSRVVIVGQGESGKYYELAPGPWGEFRPFGSQGRRQYDTLGIHTPKFAANTLRHTKHEPITRVLVIEEWWAKHYNLPDKLWNERYEQPKDIHKYYHVRHICTPTGEIVTSYPTWLSWQYSLAVSDNPRLYAEQQRGRPFFVYRKRGASDLLTPGNGVVPGASQRIGSRLGGN